MEQTTACMAKMYKVLSQNVVIKNLQPKRLDIFLYILSVKYSPCANLSTRTIGLRFFSLVGLFRKKGEIFSGWVDVYKIGISFPQMLMDRSAPLAMIVGNQNNNEITIMIFHYF